LLEAALLEHILIHLHQVDLEAVDHVLEGRDKLIPEVVADLEETVDHEETADLEKFLLRNLQRLHQIKVESGINKPIIYTFLLVNWDKCFWKKKEYYLKAISKTSKKL
jgi:hypothetical protein